MKKTLFAAIAMAATLVCSCYDDSALTARMDDLEARMDKLEKTCSDLNADVQAMDALVKACDARNYVTGVESASQDGKTGYKISFANGDPIYVWNGNDGADGKDGVNGQDGKTPVIGVKQDTDGKYYWTLDGEFILVNGAKVLAGAENGITPVLKVENEKWYVSYDGGKNWDEVGPAVSADSKYFADVTEDSEYVYISLAGSDTVIKLAKKQPLTLTINDCKGVVIAAGGTVEIPFTLGGTDLQTVEADALLTTSGWKATVTRSSYTEGTVTVTAPSYWQDGKVALIVSNASAETIIKFITFDQGVLTVTDATMEFEAAGETKVVTVNTNYADFYFVNENEVDWMSCSRFQTKAEAKDYEINLTVAENTDKARQATIGVYTPQGKKMTSITVKQKSGLPAMPGDGFAYKEQVGGKTIKATVNSYDYIAQNADYEYCSASWYIAFDQSKDGTEKTGYAYVKLIIDGTTIADGDYQWTKPDGSYYQYINILNVPVKTSSYSDTVGATVMVYYNNKTIGGSYSYYYASNGSYIKGCSYTVVE